MPKKTRKKMTYASYYVEAQNKESTTTLGSPNSERYSQRGYRMNLFYPDVAHNWLQEQEQKLNMTLAIPRNVAMAMRADQVSLSDVLYLSRECTRQHTDPMRVYYMARALKYARQKAGPSHPHDFKNDPIKLEHILMLGYLIEPDVNEFGVRRGGVMVGGNIKIDPRKVPRQLELLVDAQRDLEPDEWYREYEEIHPFGDGNGRSGSILWNWLCDTLHKPADPPDFWGFYEATGIPRR